MSQQDQHKIKLFAQAMVQLYSAMALFFTIATGLKSPKLSDIKDWL